MNLLKRITLFNKISRYSVIKITIFILFILLHLFLININSAEWGDSYRILRASEYIRKGNYPPDEKRPPLFSIILAVRPSNVDAVTWGRGVMFVFSVLSFLVFNKLVSLFIKDEKYKIISLLLFILNPVYLYWSLRIMADVPFSLCVLSSFYLLTKWKEKISIWKSIFIGSICGLAILTRFEGYLLTFSVLLGLLFNKGGISNTRFNFRKFMTLVVGKLSYLVSLGLTTLIVISPWLLYRNPLTSKYFNEPSGRSYDIKMIWIYFTSLLYLFGFSSAFYFIFKSIFRSSSATFNFLKENIGIVLFIILELVLILLWPAAIPRLFVCIVPFLLILFSLSLKDYEETSSRINKKDLGFLLLLLIFYISSQFILKLQFLVVIRSVFIVIILLQVLSITSIYFKKISFFIFLSILSSLVWSLSTVYIHKDIYSAIKEASLYVINNLDGKIVYNDTTSVADWYINYSNLKNPNTGLNGEYLNMTDTKNIYFSSLDKSKVSYLILTNEDGISYKPGIENFNYLNLIKDFRYNIKDTQFFAKVFEFTGGNLR